MIVFGDHAHAVRIASSSGAIYNPVADQCISRIEGDVFHGGALFQAFTGVSIFVHIAGFTPNWIARDLIWTCFHYPFIQLHCERMFAQAVEDNQPGLEIITKFGFKEIARIPGVLPRRRGGALRDGV